MLARVVSTWIQVFVNTCSVMLLVGLFGLQLLLAQNLMVKLQNKFKENEDRVGAMSSHLKNVRQELLHTQVSIGLDCILSTRFCPISLSFN